MRTQFSTLNQAQKIQYLKEVTAIRNYLADIVIGDIIPDSGSGLCKLIHEFCYRYNAFFTPDSYDISELMRNWQHIAPCYNDKQPITYPIPDPDFVADLNDDTDHTFRAAAAKYKRTAAEGKMWDTSTQYGRLRMDLCAYVAIMLGEHVYSLDMENHQ